MRKILWISIIFFTIFFSYLSIKRYRTLNSYYYDLGIMNQTVYNTSRGRILEMTNQDLMKNTSRFAIHFDPILAVFAPFYLIYPGPEVLLVGQAGILALGALAVYLTSEKVLRKKTLSLAFSLSYLFYFSVQRAALFDFHAVTLATTFLLFALYFNILKNYRAYFIFIFLSLLTKEHVGLVVFLLGLYQFFIEKKRQVGLLTSVLGIVFFVSTVYVVIPYFRGSEHFASGYFSNLSERLKTIINEGFSYSLMLLSPVFYALFSPLTLFIAAPEWAINVLSINGNQRSFYFHYSSIIVSFIFFSLILGYKNLDKMIKVNWIKKLIFILFIFLNLRSVYLWNPIPSFVKQPSIYKNISPVTESTIKLWQKKLKDEDIKVSTTPKLAPFFTNRRYYFNFLYDTAFEEMGKTEKDVLEKEVYKFSQADYVIINKLEVEKDLPKMFYDKLTFDKDFKKIFTDNENLEVYRKI